MDLIQFDRNSAETLRIDLSFTTPLGPLLGWEDDVEQTEELQTIS